MSREDLVQSVIVLGEFGYGVRLSTILDEFLGTALFKAEMKKRTDVDITYINAIPHFLDIAKEYDITIPTMVESYKIDVKEAEERVSLKGNGK